MAFDFAAASRNKMARKQPKKQNQDFETAKDLACTTHFDTQVKLHTAKDWHDKNGNQKASNWMRKDEKGAWWISFRIKSKPIYFTKAIEDENGWFESTGDVISDLNAVREEVAAGKWDKEAREAFNRPSSKQASTATEEEV